MEVAVTELRAHLRDWIVRARAGDEVVITERGTPVARLVPVDGASALDRLTAEGVIAAPRGPRPRAAGRTLPRATRPVADHVTGERR